MKPGPEQKKTIFLKCVRAGSREKRNIPLSGYKTMNTLKIATQSISTRPHEQREHIGEAVFVARAVVGEIWVLFVSLGKALLHENLIGL